MPRILNKRTATADELRRAVYVGRPTRWGNPHPIGFCQRCERRHDRADAIATFTAELTEDQKADARQHLRGADLSCWCWPLPCHANVWREIANA